MDEIKDEWAFVTDPDVGPIRAINAYTLLSSAPSSTPWNSPYSFSTMHLPGRAWLHFGKPRKCSPMHSRDLSIVGYAHATSFTMSYISCRALPGFRGCASPSRITRLTLDYDAGSYQGRANCVAGNERCSWQQALGSRTALDSKSNVGRDAAYPGPDVSLYISIRA